MSKKTPKTRREKFDSKWSEDNDLCRTCVRFKCKYIGGNSENCVKCDTFCSTKCFSKPNPGEKICESYEPKKTEE